MLQRTLLAIAAWLVAFSASAQNYQTLSPAQPVETPGKVEVIEFFWYGCPHCYSLEPEVHAWVKKMPPDVVFKRVHAIPNANWEQAARIYYTLESMGIVEQFHSKVFDAYHKENLNLNNPRIREEWLKKNGIDVAKYNEMEKSFTVQTKLNRARQMTVNYKVDGVPRLYVQGKYYTGGETGGKAFATVDQLIAMVRKEK